MPTLTVDGYPIAYAEAGSGTPLVMVHGTLGDQRSFAGQMEAFGAKYHAVSISLRHCWPDKWREDGDFTIARHTADVAGFIRALGKGRVHLIGHSRGGHIAFRVAQHHPELLASVVLLEPGGELDESLGGAPPAGIKEQRKPYARAEAAGIRTRTLLVGGDQSQPQFGRILDALEGAMPNARRVTIARAAHSVQADNAADFNAEVLKFLAG